MSGYFHMEDDDIVALDGDSGWVNVGNIALRIDRTSKGVQVEAYPCCNEHEVLTRMTALSCHAAKLGGVDPD